MEMPETVIACSLGATDIETRREEWKAVLAEHLVEQRRIPGGMRLVLRSSGDAAAEIRRLVALENACCAWIKWSVAKGDRLEVDLTAAQPQGTELLRDWFGAGSVHPIT